MESPSFLIQSLATPVSEWVMPLALFFGLARAWMLSLKSRRGRMGNLSPSGRAQTVGTQSHGPMPLNAWCQCRLVVKYFGHSDGP